MPKASSTSSSILNVTSCNILFNEVEKFHTKIWLNFSDLWFATVMQSRHLRSKGDRIRLFGVAFLHLRISTALWKFRSVYKLCGGRSSSQANSTTKVTKLDLSLFSPSLPLPLSVYPSFLSLALLRLLQNCHSLAQDPAMKVRETMEIHSAVVNAGRFSSSMKPWNVPVNPVVYSLPSIACLFDWVAWNSS